MSALQWPANESVLAHRFTSVLNKAIDDMRSEIVAVEALDLQKAQQMRPDLDADRQTADELAKQLDLSECEFLAR
jgi:hypothetical protein